MRGGVLAGGVILMLLGVALMGMMTTTQGGSWSILFLLVGLAMIPLGFIVMIAGLAASRGEGRDRSQPIIINVPTATAPAAASAPTTTTALAENQVSQVLAICPQCKNRIPVETKFCPECGADLRPGQKKQSRFKLRRQP